MLIDKNIKKLYDNLDQIEGWLNWGSLLICDLINNFHYCNNIKGELAEIGVYKGKSLALLSAMSNPGEKIYCCDSNHEDDCDISQTFDSLGFATSNIELTFCNSKDWDFHKQKYRIIHIDGDHSYEYAYRDIIRAMDHLIHNGIIVVDDVFHYMYPDVTRAIFDIVNETKLEIVAIGANKCYLAHKDSDIKGIKNHIFVDKYCKRVKLNNYEVVSFQFNEWVEKPKDIL